MATKLNREHACACGEKKNLFHVSRFNRGGKNELICPKCIEKLLAGEETAEISISGENIMKDVKTVYSFAVSNSSVSVINELQKHGFIGGAKEMRKYNRFTSPEYNKLNSPIRYQKSLDLMRDRHGAKIFNLRVHFLSESQGFSKTYVCRESDWAKFIRYAEHDFCTMIGKGNWSALNTGTRKNG